MKHNGWRKPTPGLVVAEKHAQAGEGLSIPKTQAIVAVKKVASALGLKATDMLLLDILAAVTQPQDWEQGRRPIVWPSNNFLMEQLGFSLPALKRHARRLAEVGIISFRDSPNGKRWGKRDNDGVIIEAYGFDLSPLAARAEEFAILHAQVSEEREFCKSMRSTITVTRRVIRAKIEKAMQNRLRGPWRELQAQYVQLVENLPSRTTKPEKLINIADWFMDLKQQVEQAFEAAFDWPEESDVNYPERGTDNSAVIISFNNKLNPTGINNEPHILTTKQQPSVNSNSFENKDVEISEQELPSSAQAERSQKDDLDFNWSSHTNKRGSEIDIPMLMMTCPHFAEMARSLNGYLRDWNDVHRAAGQIRPMTGISENAWNVAQEKLGPAIAAAAIALIFDKYSNNEIKSPGGYLRGMVEKALVGDLHLDRSFHGRLSEVRGMN